MFILIVIGFGLIGHFITHTTGDGIIGILTTIMGGIDLGTIRIIKIYGDHLEVTVI